MTSDVVVRCEGLTKRYGGSTVVDGVDLEIRQGEVFGILGANGAGKTTSVECLQGLRVPDAGTIRVCDLDPLRDRARLAGRIGSQLQDASLPDRLCVAEAVALFAGPLAEPVDTILERWGLASRARTAFGSLSGGQQQRLFIALALVNAPDVVFLDELTQGLDPNARRAVWDAVRRLRDDGTTVVLVTHFLDEAEELCDRIAVMRDGAVVRTGTPNELVAADHPGAVVRFTRPLDLGVDRLRALPGLSRLEEHGASVELVGNGDMIAHVGALLVANGPIPSDLQVTMPSLADVLLPIIGSDA